MHFNTIQTSNKKNRYYIMKNQTFDWILRSLFMHDMIQGWS